MHPDSVSPESGCWGAQGTTVCPQSKGATLLCLCYKDAVQQRKWDYMEGRESFKNRKTAKEMKKTGTRKDGEDTRSSVVGPISNIACANSPLTTTQ